MPARRLLVVVTVLCAIVSLLRGAWATDKVPPDPRGVELVNGLLVALTIPDADARLKAVVPLVHKSLLSRDGRDLDRSTRDFSYRKASQAAGLYKRPAQIVEVHRGRVTTIGFRETAETGRTDKYFVAKKDGVAGRPAPIHVFFPNDGGPPKIVNMGSL